MIDVETIFDSDREEYEFMQEKKEQQMKKYNIVAYADEDGNKRQEAFIEAADYTQAQIRAWKMFPEHNEIGVYEVEGNR